MSLTQYLLEFSICLTLFYSLYHFLLRKETFFQLNRWYLLLTPALAMVIPFLNMELPKEAVQSGWDQVIYPLVSNVQESQMVFWQIVETPAESARNFTYLDLLLTVYLLGVLWMAGRLFYRTWRLLRLIGQGNQKIKQGYTVVNANEDLPASSFLSYIFWEDGPISPERKSILEHELVHVRQWHSLDVILMEIWVLLKWFHPFIYWYRKSLRLTHEYIADAYVSGTSESRLAYARLLASSKSHPVSNNLVHHFHSSIKMRLIMLAKKQSRAWSYLKLVAILPATAVLLLLFSFNLAEDLPETLIDPLSRVENSFNNFAKQSILPKTVAAPVVHLNKSYKLKWGEIECDCKPEQFPNLYHCDNQSMLPNELRRLIRKKGGFEVYLEGQRQPLRELRAVSKHMKDMGGFQGQFDEMDRNFNLNSPLWKQAEKGDVFRFSFTNGSGDYFEFDVVVNNRKEDFVFGSKVEIGEFHFNLDLTNDRGVAHIDVEDLKKLIQNPLKIRKNNASFYQLKTGTVTNRRALRSDNYSRISSEDLDLSKSKAILEAFPGDRIAVQLEEKDGKEIKFDFAIRKSSAWNGRKRDFAILWGDKSFKTDRLIVLSKEEFDVLVDQEMYLFANGRKHRMEDTRMKTSTVTFSGKKPNIETKSVLGIKQFLKAKKPNFGPGDEVHIYGLKKINGYVTPSITIMVDYDWKKVFADRPNAVVSDEGRTLTITNANSEDLRRILNLEHFRPYYYEIEVDGEWYDGASRHLSGMTIKRLIDNNLPQKELVIRRANMSKHRTYFVPSKRPKE